MQYLSELTGLVAAFLHVLLLLPFMFFSFR
nr:MAG TPA: TMEM215 family [Caudoviricetes sp.]